MRRFQENGLDGLRAESKRPKSSPAAKLSDKHRDDSNRELRTRGLGSRRIQNELNRVYNFEVFRATIDKALRANSGETFTSQVQKPQAQHQVRQAHSG